MPSAPMRRKIRAICPADRLAQPFQRGYSNAEIIEKPAENLI
jgi:hypothetical protein